MRDGIKERAVDQIRIEILKNKGAELGIVQDSIQPDEFTATMAAQVWHKGYNATLEILEQYIAEGRVEKRENVKCGTRPATVYRFTNGRGSDNV